MNTPAHLIINLAVLASGKGRGAERSIALGAVIPDLPMFGFFAWETFVRATPQRVIWEDRYFDPAWQLFFDAFNSIPIAVVVGGIAYAYGQRGWCYASASAVLHSLLDLPLHREDGHRHFLPLSDWKLMSPVSYWDVEHFGSLGSGVELLLMGVASAVLWTRYAHVGGRVALALNAMVGVALWIRFYG